MKIHKKNGVSNKSVPENKFKQNMAILDVRSL
jgi:hypothetical protein